LDRLHGYTCIAGSDETFRSAFRAALQHALICCCELLDIAALANDFSDVSMKLPNITPKFTKETLQSSPAIPFASKMRFGPTS
jgi:hypothetical protein